MKNAFTIVELMVVIGIIAIILSFSTVALTSIQQQVYLSSIVPTFITDIKEQQLKSMVGDSEGRTTAAEYGIFFETNRYTFFHGTTYSANDPSNFVVSLENNIMLTNITFPSSRIIFTRGSGEISGFTEGSNTITLRNALTGEQQTITINRYGVITTVN